MGNWLTYSVPWWAWGIPALAGLVGAFFYLSRFFGVRNALGAVLIVGSGLALKLSRQRGKQAGWRDRIEREKEDARRVAQKADNARRDADALPPERLRDDDGYKRD